MSTMRVAVYYNNRDVRVEERPVPVIGPGELLVKVEACGLCGGETMEWYLQPRAPKVLGHEPTGIVAQLGPAVDGFKEGDRVFVHHHVPCMTCHHCLRGHFTMCVHYGQTNIDPGGFAEYFRVPAENVRYDTLLLPDRVSFEAGTLIEPLGCVLKGLKVAGIQPGDTVAIIGVGFMGMGFIQLTRLWGAGRIFALDFSDWRLNKALELGADHAINPQNEDALGKLHDLNNGYGADSVIVTAPSLSAVELGLSLAGKGATLHVNAPPPPDAIWRIHATDLYFREVTLTFSYSATHIETRQVLTYLTTGRIAESDLITHRFGLDGVAKAIELLLAAGESLKSVIIPSLVQVGMR
jgi:L-iditol 2-dehydrogenase